MYIPSFNKFSNSMEAMAFMERYSFATIVTADDSVPNATHLPFLIEVKDDKIILLSHFARANSQASGIDGKKALVIFMEPHAYITPKNYEHPQNVPTWNYMAVHAYGECKLLDDNESKAALLKQTILRYESDYLKQWDNLSADYSLKMMNGITAFKIVVYDLQAKKKLSQNRSEREKENIIQDLSAQQGTPENDIATYMAALKPE